jgi:hypothetical protein
MMEGTMSLVVEKELQLPDGAVVALYDHETCPDEATKQRNVVCWEPTGKQRWRVSEYGAWMNSTFTNIYFNEDGQLCGYNFDGGEYSIDIRSGTCTPIRLLK